MKRLALERHLKGLTLRDTSLRSGIAAQHISRIENGRNIPLPSTLKSLAEAVRWNGEPKDLLRDIKRGDVV